MKTQPRHFSTLTAEKLSAIHKLQRKLVFPPILALPEPRGEHILNPDACNGQVGWAKLQEQAEGTIKAAGHWSQSLKKQSKLTTPHSESVLRLFGLTQRCERTSKGHVSRFAQIKIS